MTIREIAETAGCNEKTVRRIVGDKMPGKIQNGKVTRFTWDEAHQLMAWLPKRNQVDLGHDLGQMSEVATRNLEGSTLTPRDMELIAGIMTAVMANLDGRVKGIEAKIESRQALLPAPQVKPRDHVNQIVRRHADRSGMDFSTAWRDLYREFGYRTNSAPTVAAKNRGMGVLDYLEAEGLIDTLEAVALEWAK